MPERFTHFRLPNREPLIMPPGNPVHRTTGGGPIAPFFPLSNGGGYDPYGHERIPATARVVSVSARILGTQAERQAQISAWKQAVGQRGRLFRWNPEHVVNWQYARLALPDIETSANFIGDHGHTDITMQWLIYGDHWNGVRHGAGGMDFDADPPDYFDEDLALDYDGSVYDTEYTLSGSPYAATLNNAGDATQTAAVFTFTPDSASFTSIAAAFTGYEWSYGGEVHTQQRLVVDTGSSSVRLVTDLTADAAQGATTLVLAKTSEMAAGEFVDVALTDGTFHFTEIATIPDATHITIATPLPGPAASGNDVGVGKYGDFTEPAYQMEWVKVAPGDNSLALAYSGGGTNPTFVADYYDSCSG